MHSPSLTSWTTSGSRDADALLAEVQNYIAGRMGDAQNTLVASAWW